MAKKHPWHSVKLSDETVKKLKSLDITYWGVNLDSYDQKINHLVWHYHSYKNNNWIKIK